MINWWTLLGLSIAYVAVLFAIARWGDRVGFGSLPPNFRAITYSLGLAVYCTSWTFYGAVGSAATSGWLYLPIYLGPILVIVLGWGLVQRIIRISRTKNLTSIADFIAARYGKARSLAVLVTLIATIGSVPYIALQLKAIVTGFDVISDFSGGTSGIDVGLVGAVALALFAILFGTRKIEVTEHHDGMMLAIAFESLVKLGAFVAVAVFALTVLATEPAILAGTTRRIPFAEVFGGRSLPDTFITQLLLASAAILCLPRQFHVTVVEARADTDIDKARWLFPLYLVLFSALVVPITLAGMSTLSTAAFGADAYVLALPMQAGIDWLTILAFLGGFSGATGMVIVACVALSTMISNEIVMPLVLRSRAGVATGRQDYSRLILGVRRLAIAGIAALGYAYYSAAGDSAALASFGLLSFAAAAQFAPLLLFGIFWPRSTRRGVLAGLTTGWALWIYSLFLPALAKAGAFTSGFVTDGPFGIGWLRPEALLFDTAAHPLTHGVAWSLGANLLVSIVVSLWSEQSVAEQIQSRTFSSPGSRDGRALSAGWRSGIRAGDLMALAERFLGEQHAEHSFADFAANEGIEIAAGANADQRLVQFTERLLAGAIGASSARVVMTTALRRTGMDIGDVVTLLDETSHAIRFNRQLLESTLENITQGVSVVDANQRIIGWNRRYEELMGYPSGAVHVGQPVAELIRYNASLGRFGDRDPDKEVAKRLDHLRRGESYVYQSAFDDGRVIEIRGQAMPDGGYVTTFTDISEFKRQETALVEAKDLLEQRVADRTGELEDAMRALRTAKQEAEDANTSKTRFLAAAAHDLLQPLNATKLFAALLHENRQQIPGEQRELVERIQKGLVSVEELLSALLDISRLDTAAPEPKIEAIAVRDLFQVLRTQFAQAFMEDELKFRIHSTNYWVSSDRALLRRILQNFLSNARRYTPSGGVLLGCRREGDKLAVQVIDTGVGISPADQARVFDEFQRLGGSNKHAERGLGLGLAIVRRIADLLGHDVRMRSAPGKGSIFEVIVPLADAMPETESRPKPRSMPPSSIVGEPILCVDNEPDILDGMQGLLSKWGALPIVARNLEQAIDGCRQVRTELGRRPSLLVVDYHLDDGDIGLDIIEAVVNETGRSIPAIVLTADHTEEVAAIVRERGYALLNKPVRPAALRAQITSILGRIERP